jgi:coenzyme F420-reducing hydrogenase beta subunit
VVDDLCHVLGVDKRQVAKIDIRPGEVFVEVRDATGAYDTLRFSWTLSYD